jgi:hypothetical protein
MYFLLGLLLYLAPGLASGLVPDLTLGLATGLASPKTPQELFMIVIFLQMSKITNTDKH